MQDMVGDYSDVAVDYLFVDNAAMKIIQEPTRFDVMVTGNLFGDILSDLGPAVVGGMGIAPGANINPEKEYPSMFEPVHGSAPDIAGQNIANPIACFWTGAMMLDHLGQTEAAQVIVSSIEQVTGEGTILTKDLGGNASTNDVTEAVLKKIRNL